MRFTETEGKKIPRSEGGDQACNPTLRAVGDGGLRTFLPKHRIIKRRTKRVVDSACLELPAGKSDNFRDKVKGIQLSGRSRFQGPRRWSRAAWIGFGSIGRNIPQFPERQDLTSEKLADVGNSATVYSVLVEVE
jgi:hypothetical protein